MRSTKDRENILFGELEIKILRALTVKERSLYELFTVCKVQNAQEGLTVFKNLRNRGKIVSAGRTECSIRGKETFHYVAVAADPFLKYNLLTCMN